MANRYFVPDLPAAGAATLRGEIAHHLGRVVRARPGDGIVLGDGAGGSVTATVVRIDRDAVVCDVGAARREPPPAPRVTVAFAVPRLPRMEWLLEHGTELGVAAFQPLATARARPHGERADRWARIVRAAAGQCDRAWLPEVHEVRELDAWLQDDALPPARFVGAGDATVALGAGTDAGANEAVVLVGPEGGFTDGERAAIDAAGFAARRLGPHILRTETAAFVGAALLLAR
jgi:16S rRNA (uracil1498-N3)-methyltransferase